MRVFGTRIWSAIYLSGCRCLSRAHLVNMSSDRGGSFSIVHAHIKALLNLIKLSYHAKAGYNNCSLALNIILFSCSSAVSGYSNWDVFLFLVDFFAQSSYHPLEWIFCFVAVFNRKTLQAVSNCLVFVIRSNLAFRTPRYHGRFALSLGNKALHFLPGAGHPRVSSLTSSRLKIRTPC